MPEKVTISHRGARYEIGRGKRCYGIWVTGAPESDPVDRWPETPDGWAQAWARFMALETPGTIGPVEQRGFAFPRLRLGRGKDAAGDGTGRKGSGMAVRAATALLALGVVLGIAGLFGDYTGQSLVSGADQLVPHLLYLAGWTVSAGLVAAGLRRGPGSRAVRPGALLGLGMSAVTLGLFGSDLGQVIAGQAGLGAGLILGIAGWAACTAGAVTGLAARDRGTAAVSGEGTGPAATAGRPAGPGRPVRPGPGTAGPVALLVLGAIGTAAAFAPSWDSYTLATQAGSQTMTLGNAFSNPGPVMTANVITMIAIIAVALIAALWRPMRQGAALLAGAIIPLAAQAISALIQVRQPASPAMFGISPAQAAQAGLTISSGVTPIFWVYCVFVIALAISCAWLFTEPALPAAPNPVPSPWAGPVMPASEEQTPAGEENPDSGTRDNGDGPEGGGPEGDTENSFA